MLRRVILLLAMCAPVPGQSATNGAHCFPAPPRKPVRVLFIGNSFTYFNNMPEMAEAIAAANGIKLKTGLVASGGETLHEHLTSGDAAKGLVAGPWDYVVLQEQSSFGDTYLVNGRFRVRPTYGWIEDAAALANLARKAGAKPILLTHWPVQDSAQDQPTIQALYDSAARKTGACLIRNSAVFDRAQATVGRSALYIEDKLHPTPLKSYLIAASVVRELAGQTLRNLPTRIEGEPIEQDEGKRLGGKVTLVTVTPRRARQIAQWAEAVQAGPGASKALPPAIPRLPVGRALPPLAQLQGLWTGPIALYPIPAVLTVSIKAGARSTVDVEIRGKGGLNKSAQAIPLETVVGNEIRFVFPNGPNGTQILFRGVRSAGGLTGIAHFRSADSSIEGYGVWSASRASH